MIFVCKSADRTIQHFAEQQIGQLDTAYISGPPRQQLPVPSLKHSVLVMDQILHLQQGTDLVMMRPVTSIASSSRVHAIK